MPLSGLNRTSTLLLTNKSGGAVAYGDVVVLDLSNAESFTTTTDSPYLDSLQGVVLEPDGIPSNEKGLICMGGYAPQINLDSAASLGDFILTDSVAKQGTPHAKPLQVGDFAEVLTAGSAPAAFLFAPMPLVVPTDLTARVLLGEATPTGASCSFTSIPATYKNLRLEFAARTDVAAIAEVLNMTFNSDTTASNYRRIGLYAYQVSTVGAASAADRGLLEVAAATALAGQFTVGYADFPQYANTNFHKHGLAHMSVQRDNSSAYILLYARDMTWRNTAAISQIDIASPGGNFVSGTVFRLYGMN